MWGFSNFEKIAHDGCKVWTPSELKHLQKHLRVWVAGKPRGLCEQILHKNAFASYSWDLWIFGRFLLGNLVFPCQVKGKESVSLRLEINISSKFARIVHGLPMMIKANDFSLETPVPQPTKPSKLGILTADANFANVCGKLILAKGISTSCLWPRPPLLKNSKMHWN